MAKVLLVEDDNNLREIYEARLQAEGYEIASAQDGEQALVVAKEVKPDLIISDVMMPKISGFEMLDILRNTEGLQNTRVIMLTALGQGEDKSRADSLGADRYLVKSQVTLEDIVKAAHQLLDEETTTEPVGESAPMETEATLPDVAPAAVEPATETEPTPEPAAEEAASAVAPEPAAPPEPVAAAPEPETPVQQPAAPATDHPTTPDPSPAGQHHTSPTPREPLPVQPPADDNESVDSPIQMPPSADLADAGTTAAEQNVIDQQIEDFIHSSIENPEEVEPTATPEAPAEPAAADTSANDQLMAEALQDLSTPESAESAPTVVAPQAAAEAPQTAESVNEGIDVAGKKKLNPIPSEPKPDINDLLAQEEAREAAANPAPTAPVVDGAPVDAEDQPSGGDQPKTPPAQPGGFDPTNITL